LDLLERFIECNEKPPTSANFKAPTHDRMEHVAAVLALPAAAGDAAVVLAVLKVLKILSRKADNRRKVDGGVLAAVVAQLRTPLTARIAAEAANVLLNICYEQKNVDQVLAHAGVAPLVALLAEGCLEVQANAAGALQSICFQANGRRGVREAGAVLRIVGLLTSENAKVCTRSVGALHNLSSDPDAIRLIRRCSRAGVRCCGRTG